MDIRELRSFVLLGEQLHYGRASRLLNLSQPALTKQIRKLEDELGSPLFERGRSGTRLSDFGEHFLRDARRTVRSFDELENRGKRAARGETGRLRIGFGFHTFEIVPRLIVRLREESPGIEVSLRDMSTEEQTRALNARTIDLGFVRTPAPPHFRTLNVVRDRLALLVGASFRQGGRVRLRDCRDEPFVALSEERAPGFHHHMMSICAKYGFHPRIVQQVPELTTAAALVRAGMGIAIIPESFWSTHLEDVRIHPLRDRDAAWQVSAAWHPNDTNPALRKILALLRAELKPTPGE